MDNPTLNDFKFGTHCWHYRYENWPARDGTYIYFSCCQCGDYVLVEKSTHETNMNEHRTPLECKHLYSNHAG